ncbi:MAG: hypothetical protein C4525_09680 [Desulfarculus sp.]|nr:MAG: hypothetical protein C4525_09680 [Desulfarculus sp.]
MRLLRPVSFDPQADLAAVADFARRWRSLFRPAEVSYTPEHFRAELERLGQAQELRLYLVTRPARPIALAILDGLKQGDLLELLALAPLEDRVEVRPWLTSPAQRRALMAQAPGEPSGQGVYAFALGRPQGMALIDLEPEGLVLALARWGRHNVLDAEPLLAQRLALLGREIQRLGRPRD